MMPRIPWRIVISLLLAMAIAAPLVSCGKRGNLEPPPGEPSDYPRKYPHD